MISINKLSIIVISAVIVSAVIVVLETDNMLVTDTQNISAIKLRPVIREEFQGNELSPRWGITENWNGTISVSDNTLTLSQGTHKRINSVFTVNDNNSTVTLTGKLLFTGYYQKFGMNVNGESAHNDVGIYFDTFCPKNVFCRHDNSTLPSANNTIYMFIREKSTAVYESKAEIMKGNFHLLQIALSPNNVTFFIDGSQVGKAKYNFSGPITIGIWNDRPPEMQVDWITIDSS